MFLSLSLAGHGNHINVDENNILNILSDKNYIDRY